MREPRSLVRLFEVSKMGCETLVSSRSTLAFLGHTVGNVGNARNFSVLAVRSVMVVERCLCALCPFFGSRLEGSWHERS